MEEEQTNPFADGEGVPDAGGYNVFAVMDDGGTLCYRCIIDPTNPIEDVRTSPSVYGATGWGIVAFSYDGAEDGPLSCDHCNATIVEDPEEFDPRRVASEWHGGQWSALYMFASSGATHDSRYDSSDIVHECQENLKNASSQDTIELEQLIAFLQENPTRCATCNDPITRVVEEHDTYWEDAEGDSLSYVPTLHDHRP